MGNLAIPIYSYDSPNWTVHTYYSLREGYHEITVSLNIKITSLNKSSEDSVTDVIRKIGCCGAEWSTTNHIRILTIFGTAHLIIVLNLLPQFQASVFISGWVTTATDMHPDIILLCWWWTCARRDNFHNFCVAKLSNSFLYRVLTDLCDGRDDLQHFECAVSHIPADIMQAFLQDRTHLINGGALHRVHKQCQVRGHEVLDGYLHQLKSLHRQLEHSKQQANLLPNSVE